MPCGLLRWQIRDHVTRSSIALDQLLADRPGGPLAEIVDVPNVRLTYGSPATLPLACLTGTGRTHYAADWAAYRDLYPDVPVPSPSPDRRGQL